MFLEAGLEACEDYLLSKELFWPLPSSGRQRFYPKQFLTLGNLMLTVARLQAGGLDHEQNSRFTRLLMQYDQIRSRWRSAWEYKCRHSFRQRLNQWRNFLEELREDPEENSDRYPYEVRWRVILELLMADIPEVPPSEKNLLSVLDTLLQALTVPGSFVWEADLESGFPAERFWFLYVQVIKQPR